MGSPELADVAVVISESDATHEATCLDNVLLETHTHAQNHPDSTVKSTLKYFKIITCGVLQTIAKPTAFVSDRWSEREIMDDYLYAV